MTLWFLGAQIIIAADTVQRVCMSRDRTNYVVMLIGEGYDPGPSLGEPTNSNDAVTKQHVDNYAENNPAAYRDTIPAQIKRAAISGSIPCSNIWTDCYTDPKLRNVWIDFSIWQLWSTLRHYTRHWTVLPTGTKSVRQVHQIDGVCRLPFESVKLRQSNSPKLTFSSVWGGDKLAFRAAITKCMLFMARQIGEHR